MADRLGLGYRVQGFMLLGLRVQGLYRLCFGPGTTWCGLLTSSERAILWSEDL